MKRLVVGVLAHVDSGKTTLSEALLYRAGSIRKLGRVDHRDAFLDTDALEKALPRLAETALKAQDIQNSLLPGEYHASCSFGEYGAPSFDSRVQTVAAAAGAGVMSVEAQVDELWGSSKDDAWKAAEVQRIRLEQGITDAAEPELDAPSGLMPGPDA